MARSVSPCVVSSPAPRVLTTLPMYAQWPDFIARTRRNILTAICGAAPGQISAPRPGVSYSRSEILWVTGGRVWGGSVVPRLWRSEHSDEWCRVQRYYREWWTLLIPVVRGNVRCELWMQGAGKMLDISLIIFGSGREMMNDMRCGGRGCICSIFPPLFNLIRSEFKAEWVSKILPVIQIPDSVLEGDDASQSQAALERPRSVYSIHYFSRNPQISRVIDSYSWEWDG